MTPPSFGLRPPFDSAQGKQGKPGRALGDVTTLADPSVLESLKTRYAEDAE